MKCEHEKEKTRCIECGGGSICLHQVVRSNCSICAPESVWKRYAHQAARRGLKFELTLAQFQEITSRPCAYCNEYGYGRGIDRKNNFEGYTPGNSQSCCAPCNKMKSDIAEHTFLGRVLKICRHQEKLKNAKLVGPAQRHTDVSGLATQ